MECDVPYKYLQILGYGYKQERVQVQEHLHESVHHIDCGSAEWLPVQHQFIQVLLFQFLFVTAYEYKEFIVVVTVTGQKLIQHFRIVVQI